LLGSKENKKSNDCLDKIFGYLYLKRTEPISNDPKDIASNIQVKPNEFCINSIFDISPEISNINIPKPINRPIIDIIIPSISDCSPR
jgi:hypothetical protein